MAVFLRKYNTLTVTGTTAIRVPMVKRGLVDFAVSADWTPAAGDVKILIDGAAAANVTNLPTAIATANTGTVWEFVLTGAELTGKNIQVVISDAATKVVEDQSFIVETFGNASATYAWDMSLANLPANVTQLLGTAWLTPGTAGTPDVNTKLLGGTAQTGADLGTKAGFALSATGIDLVLVSDLAAVPASNAKLPDALSWLYMKARNRRNETSTTEQVYKTNATSVAGTSTKSDDNVIFERGAFA